MALQKELEAGIAGNIKEDIKGLIRKKNEEFTDETVANLQKLSKLSKLIQKLVELDLTLCDKCDRRCLWTVRL